MTAKAIRTTSLPFADHFARAQKILAPSALACVGMISFACASQQRPITPITEGQSYAEAIRLICEVDRRLQGADSATEIELGQLRQDYIIENTQNPDAIYFVTVWRTKPPAEQSVMLAQQAVEQEVSDCELAKRLAEAAQAR